MIMQSLQWLCNQYNDYAIITMIMQSLYDDYAMSMQ